MKPRIYFVLIAFLFSFNSFSQTIDLNINLQEEHQTIEGFGAAVAEWLYNPNNSTTVADLAVNDMGMTILRVYPEPSFEPTNENGSSDITELGNFNLANISDQLEVVNKFIAAGLEDVILSTFSPPAWMKYNNSLVGDDCLAEDTKCQNRLRHDRYEEYAEFYSSYITTVINETGANIYAISPENEPAWGQWYSSCVFSKEEMKDIIKVLGARFDNDGIDTRIFAAEDLLRSFGEYEEVMMADEICKNYTHALATHAYSDGISPTSIESAAFSWSEAGKLAKEHGKELWMTETSGYDGAWSSETGELTYAQLIHTALRYGDLSCWVYLNVSTNSGAQENRALMVNNTPQKIFYVSKQFYRYIRPGAIRVSCEDDEGNQVFATAYKHGSDSRLTIVAINTSGSSKTINLSMDNKPNSFTHYRTSNSEDCINVGSTSGAGVTLDAYSINTFVAEGDNNLPVINKVKDTVILMNAHSEITINLSEIGDGDDDKTQSLSLTSSSSNTSLIPHPTVNYTTDNTTGSLVLQPQSNESGDATITVTLTDDGSSGNNGYFTVQEYTFNVKVIPEYNVAPEADPIDDITAILGQGLQSFTITGIQDGNNNTQTVVSVETTSSNTDVVDVTIVYTPGSATTELYYDAKQVGTSTITITLIDDAGTYLGGVDTKTMTFTITVNEDNTQPLGFGNDDNVFSVFPNPVGAILNISNSEELEKAELFNMQGMKLRSVADDCSQIPVSDLNRGNYILKLHGRNGKIYHGLIIKE